MVINLFDAPREMSGNSNVVRRERQSADDNIVDFNADELQKKISERKRSRAKRNLQAAAKKLKW